MNLVCTTAANTSSGMQATTTSVIFHPLMNATTRPPIKVTRFCGEARGQGL